MSFREGHNYTHVWGDKIKSMEKNKPFEANTPPPPLGVKDPEVLKAVKGELDYIFTLNPVQRSESSADEISLYLRKGEESKRSILSTSPRINIEFTRNQEGNITEKKMLFQRDVKKCEFIFSQGEDGEVISIGENNLDAGYNSAIHGWVQGGMRLLRGAIEEDYYTPHTSVNVEYSNNSFDNTDQSIKGTPKGPMEI